MTQRQVPWTDFEGNPLKEGDVIQHPEGDPEWQTATIVFDEGKEGPLAWRAVYKGGESLWLGNQIGDKGRAVLKK